MENYTRTYKLLAWVAILLAAAYYVTVLFLGEVPKDDADGLQHFSISKESWNQSALLLAHWGKPFFILFSSGFAQFGFQAYVCFNILVYIISCLLALRILEHYGTPRVICLFFPLILLSIPDYSYCVVAGMTEPFFGLLLLCLFLFALKEKWFWFALLASFTPFARSEGMLLVVAAVPYLLLLRKYKYIPLLAAGFALYALAGWLILDQPWWYFENNPYSEFSIYGSGPWYSYITSFLDHTGLIALVFLPIMLFGLVVWYSKRKKADLLHVLFFAGIYLGIIIVHSYLWAKGLRGALGLSRLATLGLLPFLVIEAVALGYVLRELHKLVHAFVALCVGILVFKELTELELPAKTTIQQEVVKEVSLYLDQKKERTGTIYYFNPLIAYYLGSNSYDLNNTHFKHRFIHLQKDVKSTFRPGDLIVRDSKFGPREQGLLLDELQNYPWIVPIKHFYVPHYYVESNGEAQSVIIYQVMDKNTFNRLEWEKSRKIIDKRISKKAVRTEGKITVPYFSIDSAVVLPKLYGPRQELVCEYSLETPSNQPIHLIFNSTSGYYISVPLDPEKHEIALSFVTGKIKGILFLHNPNQQPFKLTFEEKSWRQIIDSDIQPLK